MALGGSQTTCLVVLYFTRDRTSVDPGRVGVGPRAAVGPAIMGIMEIVSKPGLLLRDV